MHRELSIFFYTLCININNIIGINIFLLPFFLYKNPVNSNITLFFIISFLFILLFITCYRIKKNIILDIEKSSSYLYFLSDYFYYISLLCIINTNIFYINKIINLYNNISLFYSSIAIVIILFLLILIKNNTSNINNILILIKLIIFIPAIYFLYTIPANIQNIASDFKIQNILGAVPILFFSFLGNNYTFDIDENTEEPNVKNNIIKYILIIATFLIINILYTLFYKKITCIFNYNLFLLNGTLSEILLKQYTNNSAIHFLNIFIIILSFFNIYTITLQCQKIIEKTIQKTNQGYIIPEIIILFFVLFSILIISKILISQEKNIIFISFFSTLSFLCYIINVFKLSNCNLDTMYMIISISFLLIINIISIHQLIVII